MKTSSKLTAGLVILAVLSSCTGSASAWTYTATGPWASFSFPDGWTVYQDAWGAPNDQSCVLYANSSGNFACYVNYTGGGVKNYCHTQKDVDLPISSSYYCNASFNCSALNNPWWNFMFDVWTANMQDELIICENWNGDGIWGNLVASNVTIGGRLFREVRQANNGANNVLIFTPSSKRSSGSEDIMAFFIWSKDRGLLHNSTLHQVSFGVEVTYTSGWQQFTCNSFSCNYGQSGGGGGGGIANGTYKIVARHSGKAMDASGWGTANGTQIVQWTYGGGNNQRWTVTNLGNNEYKIIGVHSGKGLDINGSGTSNGTKVQLWDYFGGANQRFYITATSGGYYRITPVHAPNSCLDVEGVSGNNGAKVHLWTYGGGNNQQWAFQAP